MKNYELIEKDIDIIISYSENNILFKSLQNAIRQDLFRFLDEVDCSFLEQLNLTDPFDTIVHSMNLQIKINKKFKRDENKVIKNNFDILITLLKESLISNLKSAKGKAKISTHQIKFMGYLKYYELEIEKNDTEHLDSYFGFYKTFHQNVKKITEIVLLKKMLTFYENEINEKFVEILSYLLQNITSDVESLKNAPIRRIKSFVLNFAEFYRNFNLIFAQFEFKSIQAKFNDPIKTIFNYSIELCSETSSISDKNLASIDIIEFLEILSSKLAEFVDLAMVPLGINKCTQLYDLIDKIFLKFGKRAYKVFSILTKNKKTEVLLKDVQFNQKVI